MSERTDFKCGCAWMKVGGLVQGSSRWWQVVACTHHEMDMHPHYEYPNPQPRLQSGPRPRPVDIPADVLAQIVETNRESLGLPPQAEIHKCAGCTGPYSEQCDCCTLTCDCLLPHVEQTLRDLQEHWLTRARQFESQDGPSAKAVAHALRGCVTDLQTTIEHLLEYLGRRP